LTTITQSQVLTDVIKLMEGLSGEWEYSGPVTPDLRFFADMELKSLDFAIISAEVVRFYGRIPFDVFYQELAERPAEDREVTVQEYVDFVCRNLPQTVTTR
jgi:acyl carrier protein